jgi:hypothetical protein
MKIGRPIAVAILMKSATEEPSRRCVTLRRTAPADVTATGASTSRSFFHRVTSHPQRP